MHLNKPLPDVYVSKKEYPNLRVYIRKWLSVFGNTCLCEQFFSKLNIIKIPCRPSLTDENLSMPLRVATIATLSVRPNIKRLLY